MCKRQLTVLLHLGEAKVFAAEEKQSVEEDDGGVRSQLFTVPQKLLLHTGVDITCRGKVTRCKSEQTDVRLCNTDRDKGGVGNSPLGVIEGLKPRSKLVNSVENLL